MGEGWQPIINLLCLNGHVTLTKFKIETVFGFGVYQEGGIMFLIYLEDVYFQIPIHVDSPPILHVTLVGKVYHFKALCFGLSTAPQVATSVCSGVGVGSQERDDSFGIWCFCLLFSFSFRFSRAPVNFGSSKE